MSGGQQTLGERLRHRRWNELRLFQEDVAHAAHLSPGFLSELEADRTRVTVASLRRLAMALGIDPDDLIDHARRTGRIGNVSSRTKSDATLETVPPPSRARPRVTHPLPDQEWVTADVAAEVLGCGASLVRNLIRRGALAPAKRVQIEGRGHARWLIARSALASYVPRNEGRAFPRGSRSEPPPGYLSLTAYADAAGIPYATLHRRVMAGEIPSLVQHGRRWVKADDADR